MPAKMDFDPFGLLLKIFNESGCRANVVVEFVSGLHEQEGAWGRTHYPDTKGPIEIHIDGECPVSGAVDVLAHELAHVMAGFRCGHGGKWGRAYAGLRREYEKRTAKRGE